MAVLVLLVFVVRRLPVYLDETVELDDLALSDKLATEVLYGILSMKPK